MSVEMLMKHGVRTEMIGGEFNFNDTVRVSSKRARYLAPTAYLVLVELVTKRRKCLTRTLFGPQLLVLRNNCCLEDLVHRLLCAAAFSCFRLPISRVLLQIQYCVHLPEDVVIDILLMLPVKTLLRFKAVCKTWNKIICSKYFENQHFGREGNPTHLLVCWRGGSATRQQHSREDHFEDADSVSLFPKGALESPHLELGKGLFTGVVSAVCGPCNGILCVRFCNGTFALWNPATRKLWPIPESPQHVVEEMEFSFWIDHLTNEFKIFWIGYGGLFSRRIFFITYTSSNDSWNELEAPFYDGDYVPCQQYGYSVSNGFYYFVKRNLTTHHDAIIAYDICKDLFQEIRMPKFEIVLERHFYLSLFGDSLALFTLENVNGEARSAIWVMKEKGCWTKLFNLDLPVGKRAYYQPLGFWKPDEVFISCFTQDRPHISELMIYDRVSGKSRKILVETREGLFSANFFPFCYKESLISFKIKEARVDDIPVFGFEDTNQPIELEDFAFDAYRDGLGDSPNLMNGSERLMNEATLETSCY